MTPKFPLTRRTLQSLEEDASFFAAFGGETKEKTGLKLKAGDAEAGTITSVLPNGDIQVEMVLPLDDNAIPGDGRIYLKEKFVFDAKEERFLKHQRSFEMKPLPLFDDDTNAKAWQDRLALYQALPLADANSTESFALKVARSHARPLSPVLRERLEGLQGYLTGMMKDASAALPGYKLKIGDVQAHSIFLPGTDSWEVALSIPVDLDKDPANGRLICVERFFLDPRSKLVKSVKREWYPAQELRGPELTGFQGIAASLSQKAGASAADAEKFLAPLRGELLKPPQAAAADSGGDTPLKPASAWQRRNARRQSQAVVQAQRLPRDAGLLLAVLMERGDQLGISARKLEGLKNLLERSPAEGENPQNAFDYLQARTKDSKEKSLLNKLAQDPLAQKIQAALAEEGSVGRSYLMNILRADLMGKDGLPQAAAHWLKSFGSDSNWNRDNDLNGDLRRLDDVLSGGGQVGAKMEYFLPRVAGEAMSPALILSMAMAPAAGGLLESGMLSLAARAEAPMARMALAKFGAPSLGLLGEAGGFTLTHQAALRLAGSPEAGRQSLGQEFVATAMMFGLARIAHGISGLMTSEMAGGRFGSWAQKPTGEAFLEQSPFGRIWVKNQLPDLSWRGWALSGVATHAGGIFAMQAANYLSRSLEMAPQNNQDFAGNFFDASWNYLSAALGYRIGNQVLGGRPGGTLGMRLRNKTDEVLDATRPRPAGSGGTPSGKKTKGGKKPKRGAKGGSTPGGFQRPGTVDLQAASQKYLPNLESIYGPNMTAGVLEAFAALHKNFPGFEDLFNPGLLKAARDADSQTPVPGQVGVQAQYFARMQAALQTHPDFLAGDGQFRQNALREFERILEARKPFQPSTLGDAELVAKKYGEDLRRIFGNQTGQASSHFAALFLNLQDLEIDFNPRIVSQGRPGDIKKVFGWYAARKNALTDENLMRSAWVEVHRMEQLFDDQQGRLVLEGWGPPADFKAGRRAWELKGDKAFFGGRAPWSAIHLHEPFVSDQHFQIIRSGGKWFIQDLGSRNGTLLNGQHLSPMNSTPIKEGFQVQVGTAMFRVELVGDSLFLRETGIASASAPPPPADPSPPVPPAGPKPDPKKTPPASTPPPPAGKAYDKFIPPNILKQWWSEYRASLGEVYGNPEGNEARLAAAFFMRLMHNFPEQQEAFNPKKWAEVKDLKSQLAMMDVMDKAIQKEADQAPEFAEAAKVDLKGLSELQKVYLKATPAQGAAVRAKYENPLKQLFGAGASSAAAHFANIYLNFPDLEADFNPEALAKLDKAAVEKWFNRKIKAKLMPDRFPVHYKGISHQATIEAGKIQALLEFHQSGGVGAPPPPPDTAADPAAAPPPPGPVHGPSQVWNMASSQTYDIGRDINGTIFLDDGAVSMRHCVIFFDYKSERWFIEDRGSTNGTHVLGRRLEPKKPQVLEDGAIILIGHQFLRFDRVNRDHARLTTISAYEGQAGRQASDPPPANRSGGPFFDPVKKVLDFRDAHRVDIRLGKEDPKVTYEPNPFGHGMRYVLQLRGSLFNRIFSSADQEVAAVNHRPNGDWVVILTGKHKVKVRTFQGEFELNEHQKMSPPLRPGDALSVDGQTILLKF